MNKSNTQNFIRQLSIDCVIFGYQECQLKVLLPKMNLNGNFWALPSGYINQEEGIDQAARRILEQRTGITDVFLEQFSVFGKEGRTNKNDLEEMLRLNKGNLNRMQLAEEDFAWITQRFVSIGYYALVDINKVVPTITEIDESIEWYNIKTLPKMILDHDEMVEKALETLQLYIDQKLIAFNLLPETFTMKDIQELYETIFNKPFARNNFQKKILDLNVLERLEKKFTGAANKAPYLYRLIK